MENGRLLLLLQFSSPNFFPLVLWTLLPSLTGPGWAFGLDKTPEFSDADFPFPVGASSRGGAVWKNLCRAVCVFWAEAVQELVGGAGPAGFTVKLRGAESTDEGRGGVCLDPFTCLGPFLLAGSEEEGGLQGGLLWLMQIKVSGSFPGL